MWVFGYGSLIWHPDFPFSEAVPARLDGYHRSFCMWSIHHRGSEVAPGLVLALDESPGSHCPGLAYHVETGAEEPTLAALRERELISSAYRECLLPLDLADGRRVEALAYVVERDHRQYCQLSLEEQAEVIARAEGGRGPNRDYLWNTTQHLNQLGLGDPDLDWLSRRVTQLCAPEKPQATET